MWEATSRRKVRRQTGTVFFETKDLGNTPTGMFKGGKMEEVSRRCQQYTDQACTRIV